MSPGVLRLGSLQRRLLAGAAVFILGALVVASTAIGFVLHRFARAQIDGRLDAQIAALAADLDRGPDGARLRRGQAGFAAGPDAVLAAVPGPPGWHWQVRAGATVLRSGSLAGGDLPLPARPDPAAGRPVPGDGADPRGVALILRTLSLPAGPGVAAVTITASAPAAVLDIPLREAARTLVLTLGLLGLCLILGVLAQVRLGLRPLDGLSRALAEVRAGRRACIPTDQPSEIAPLANELNLLLEQNARGLDQARGHVANLAHGLKTPLATLAMALDASRDPDGQLRSLVAAMDARVRHHLRRARAAALDGPARRRTDLGSQIADLVAALTRIHAGRGVAIRTDLPLGLAAACDPQDVDEMLGNLIDNACRWACGAVTVEGAREGAQVRVRIEDDGPGLSEPQIAEVLRRGRRLDESREGDGFGLPITLELAELYGGGLTLDRSGLGGLRVDLRLPA